MSLAIFDLDNTLIGGDSDHSWGEFLCEKNVVDRISYKKTNDQFYDDYKAGQLDMEAYSAFVLEPIRAMSRQESDQLHREFMQEKIAPMLLPKAGALINKHRQNGDTLMVITATNRFITAPIVAHLGIPHLLATEPEIIDGQYTGKIEGTACFQHGKVERLNEWCKTADENLDGSFFYSDSFNDLPLLEQVSYPCAVDPDNTLRSHAENNNWPIISLR